MTGMHCRPPFYFLFFIYTWFGLVGIGLDWVPAGVGS